MTTRAWIDLYLFLNLPYGPPSTVPHTKKNIISTAIRPFAHIALPTLYMRLFVTLLLPLLMLFVSLLY